MRTTSSLASPNSGSLLHQAISRVITIFNLIPDELISLLARFSIASIFWLSGQTKIQGLVVDIISGNIQFGWPRLSESAVYLFKEEYRLPLLSPELAALMAAIAEHTFSILLVIGFATRLSALGLFVMTMTIQLFVYPDAYPTHGVWAVALLFLMAKGPGRISIDHWLVRQYH